MKSQKGFVQIILVLILIAGALGAVYYFGTLKNKPSLVSIIPTSTPVVSAQPVVNSTVKPTSDPTVNWKTYTNQKYNFTFRYPGDWNTDDAGSLIAVSDTQDNYSLQIDAIEVYESGYCYTWDKETIISVAGKSARIRNGTYTGKPAEICGTPSLKNANRTATQIFIPYQGSIELLINYYYPVTELDTAKTTLTQILSTFKFTK